VPKGKKVKVLIHQPRYIEPAIVPEFGEGASSTVEARQAALIVQSVEEPTVMLKVSILGPAEAKNDKSEEPQVEKIEKMPEILSPPTEAKLPKVQKAPAATPKRRRMASVLDAVLETTKALSPGPTKKNAEAAKVQDEAEAGPSAPIEAKAVVPEDKADQQTSDTSMEKSKIPCPQSPS
jgi:ribosomal protein L14E/L6E/L27E